MRVWAGIVTGLALLAGCSNSGDAQFGELRGLVSSLRANQAPAPDLRAQVTPDLLAAQTLPLMLAELPQRGAQAGLQRVSQNGDVALWLSPDGITVALERGVLVATRGLGGDLLSADLDQVHQALRGDRDRALKVLRYLDGEDQVVIRSFICDYSRAPDTGRTAAGSFAATRVTEDCASSDLRVVNLYWLDRQGILRKTQQWVGPFVGTLVTELLVD